MNKLKKKYLRSDCSCLFSSSRVCVKQELWGHEYRSK